MPKTQIEPVTITIWHPPALHGVTVADFSTDGRLFRAVKDRLATVWTQKGRAAWWALRKTWQSSPDILTVKLPGEVHRETERDGPAKMQVLVFDDALVAETRAAWGRPFAPPASLTHDVASAAAAPIVHLHKAIAAGASILALQTALVGALDALTALTSATPASLRLARLSSAPVRRARERLDDALTDDVSLDEIARHAGMDKYHLARAFTDAVGLAPYEYLTHRRIARARTLLSKGIRPAEVASLVGLYDQSQLNRHFKRIVGVTPGAYLPKH